MLNNNNNNNLNRYQDAQLNVPLQQANANQEPFSRSEDAFRFGKLHQQDMNRRNAIYNNASEKPVAFSFGIPDAVSPASVAAHFPNSASHFPSSHLITTKVPADREAATRFDALHARRNAIAPYESARHEAASFRRNDFIRKTMMDQQRAELKRLDHLGEARDRKSHIETNNNFAIPTHVSLAGVAAHFPNTATHFPMGGQSKVPIAFEEAHRFDGLEARREALAGRDAYRMDAAAERHEELLVHRQAVLEDKDRLRQEGIEKAKARRAQLFAAAMAAQRGMKNKQNLEQREAFQSNNNIPQSTTTLQRGADEGMLINNDPKSFIAAFALPAMVMMSKIERHFPNAARAMHEFEEKDAKRSETFGKEIPLEEEEAIRFDLVPIRRAAIAKQDQKRQEDGVTRGLAIVETRRFIAKNESLMRARRTYNKDNAGWVNHVAVTTSALKKVDERGTWSNVKKANDPVLVVADKHTSSSHVADPKLIVDANNNVVLADDKKLDNELVAADHKDSKSPIIHASRDETGKPLVSEADIAAAAAAQPTHVNAAPEHKDLNGAPQQPIQAQEPTVVTADQSLNNNNEPQKTNTPPVHQQQADDAKVRPKKFCC